MNNETFDKAQFIKGQCQEPVPQNHQRGNPAGDFSGCILYGKRCHH